MQPLCALLAAVEHASRKLLLGRPGAGPAPWPVFNPFNQPCLNIMKSSNVGKIQIADSVPMSRAARTFSVAGNK